MTPLHCPHCRRPIDGELEHGVCPPREVAPHVWGSHGIGMQNSHPITDEQMRALADAMQNNQLTTNDQLRAYADAMRATPLPLLRVNRPKEEDFGDPLTPRRLWWSRFWHSEWALCFKAIGVGLLASAALLALILAITGDAI